MAYASSPNAGNWEPEFVRSKRMVKHWQAQERQDLVPQASWEQLQGTTDIYPPDLTFGQRKGYHRTRKT